jgi:hypothetical protein
MPASKATLASIRFILTACAPAHTANVAPQSIAPISAGDRLRVTHNSQCCTSPVIGTEQSMSADSLVLKSADGMRFAIARSNITGIERWNTRGRTHMGVDAMLGFLAGALAGGLIGYESGCRHCDGDWRPLTAYLGAVYGGVAGLIVGLVVGANPRGFWETVS